MKSSHKIQNQTVMITGGCGFIGSHLANKLLYLGEVRKVFVVDSLAYGTTQNLDIKDRRIKFIKFNLGTDPIGKLNKHLKECDLVFHLAAQKHNQSTKEPDAVYKTNIKGTAEIFEAAGKAGVKKIVFSSSLYAYGKTLRPAMKETDTPYPTTPYGISKLTGEHLLVYFGKKYNLNFVTLRFFFVYGPKQYPGLGYKSVIIKNFERILKNQPPIINGDGKQELDYIYIDDVIDAIIAATESDVSDETFNVGSGKGTSINHLTAEMLRVSGKKIDPTNAPSDWTARTSRVSNTTKIKKILGWKPRISLNVGLTKTHDWLRSQKS